MISLSSFFFVPLGGSYNFLTQTCHRSRFGLPGYDSFRVSFALLCGLYRVC